MKDMSGEVREVPAVRVSVSYCVLFGSVPGNKGVDGKVRRRRARRCYVWSKSHWTVGGRLMA